MRTSVLLPLTALAAIVTGCGSQGREEATASLPHRDLTLATQAAPVEVASPVELRQIQAHYRTVRSSRPTARRSHVTETKPAPAPVAAVPATVTVQPVAEPARAAEPANDRELLPGKTITIIPVSSGPSTSDPSAGADWTDQPSGARGGSLVGGGGGRCRGRGRGPGIGIATAPRPDFR